jgi:hypothetical protein
MRPCLLAHQDMQSCILATTADKGSNKQLVNPVVPGIRFKHCLCSRQITQSINTKHNPTTTVSMDFNQDQSMDAQPLNRDIVPPNTVGHVIFECDDKTSFLVSSAILRLASKYFKKLLDGNFQEAQVPRSVANPQRIQLGEVNSHAMFRLLRLLHHQCDPDTAQHLANLVENQPDDRIAASARRLHDFAVATDYCGCSQWLSRVIDSLLGDFATPGIRDRMSFAATVHATSAAFPNEVNCLASHKCSKCDVTRYDHTLVVSIGQNLAPKLECWPPRYVRHHSIRDVLSAIGSMGVFYHFEQDPKKLCSEHENRTYRSPEQFRRIADSLGKLTYGLCYRCTRSGRVMFQCEHMFVPYNLMARMSELDPLT